MADLLTHIILADAVSQRIESRRILEGVTQKRSLYYLGAQGPDPLFYYNFSRRDKGVLKGLGDRMHREKTGEFLHYGFSRLQNTSYDKAWTDLAVYLCGFICHFTLDRMLHPYVCWASDKWIWAMDGTPCTVSHSQVEMQLDVLLWEEKKNIPPYRVRTRGLVDIGPEWPQSVMSFLKDAFLEIYGIEAGQKEMNKILSDFYRGNDMLYDPRGWKKVLVGWLEGLTGGGLKPPKHPYPVSPNTGIDWANRKKRTWYNPFAEGENFNASADEILEDAAGLASQYMNVLFARIFKGGAIDDLFQNLSYITGAACE